MADTRVQMKVEQWVRDVWMPTKFNRLFNKNKGRLSSGGVFEFDAVSEDQGIAAVISTSCSTTASGKNAIGKRMKIRADLFFLLLSNADRKLAVFTDASMKAWCLKEKENGRIPDFIELWYVELPPELQAELVACQRIASAEVSPNKAKLKEWLGKGERLNESR